jgi:release factor glutamine methyltransferase
MIPASKPSSGIWRVLRRIQHAFVYHLFVRRALARTDVTTMFGLRLTVPPSVFHPKFFRTTRFLGEYLQNVELRGKSFLEMGCGSGILSLLAARGGATVTAADINPQAVATTRANASINRLGESVSAIESDLFAEIPASGGFDYLLWNPPFYPLEPTDSASHAWNAGTGYGVLARFAGSAGEYLRPGGKLIIQVSTEIDAETVLSLFSSRGLKPALVASKRLPFETLSIYEFSSPHHEH